MVAACRLQAKSFLAIGLTIAIVSGCARSKYRIQSDQLAACVLNEKVDGRPWQLPSHFSVTPHRDSRFYDRTCQDDPQLPNPAPKLYEYCLPRLAQHDPNRFRQSLLARQQTSPPGTGPAQEVDGAEPNEASIFEIEPAVESSAGSAAPLSMPDWSLEGPRSGKPGPELARLPKPDNPERGRDQTIALVSYDNLAEAYPTALAAALFEEPAADSDSLEGVSQEEGPQAEDGDRPSRLQRPSARGTRTDRPISQQGGLRVVAIPSDTWESLPDTCLRRMLEFRSVRDEYSQSFRKSPAAEIRDRSPRLALEDIVSQALINSRALQTEKERLYRAALCLSLERFAYDIKFASSNNGSSLNYSHDRADGLTVNSLGIPTQFQLEKMLWSGGDFILGFANNVLLTFNGPAGFTNAVSSEIVTRFSQSLLQTDVRFESLTQAERDVVYAARSFARFRKTMFRDLANQYYGLLLTYRGIEIDSQDYFSNLRGLLQAQAEYRAGRLPRFQVDQFEQNALASRSNLISSCNDLESSFDQLKLNVGLPPETPINLDLRELDELTLRDEATVAGELVRRAFRNVSLERQQANYDPNVLLNGAIDLAGRTLTLLELRDSLGHPSDRDQDLRMLWAELQVNEAEMLVDFHRDVLEKDAKARPPAPPLRLFQRTMEVIESQLTVVERQLDWLDISRRAPGSSTGSAVSEPDRWDALEASLNQLIDEHDAIKADLVTVVEKRQLKEIPKLVRDASQLLRDADELAERAAKRTNSFAEYDLQDKAAILKRVDHTVTECEQLAFSNAAGLAPIALDMDDAMLTALVQRFDLMNERGALADQWRQIKLAGDDLRSILNLNAGFRIGTDANSNAPFNFTFDESTATLGLEFDAPLNRRTQAKDYRLSLINYNAALRNLMAMEDDIKVSVRGDLRDLQLDREQYNIAVASAALAKERVVSTRLQLRLGIENVAARDVLESQQAYTASLSSVARQHIRYVLDRIQLFVDLELLEVDDQGFWPELYNEDYAPLANWQFPVTAGYAYGSLPSCVWYSECMRRMDCVPFGQAEIGTCPTYPAQNQPDAQSDPSSQSPLDAAPTTDPTSDSSNDVPPSQGFQLQSDGPPQPNSLPPPNDSSPAPQP